MDAWIKIIIVLILLSMLSWVVGMFLYDPFVALILMAAILTILVIFVEPATGKAMAQVTFPLIILLFIVQVYLTPGFTLNELWMLLVLGAVLYLMFTMFTGGGGLEGGLFDPSIAIKLFPLFGMMVGISILADPTFRTTVLIMAGTILCMMAVYAVALRGYDKWPTQRYIKTTGLTALTDINPTGKVKAGSEIWWARTSGEPIKAGEQVRIVRISGLTLVVTKLEPEAEQS